MTRDREPQERRGRSRRDEPPDTRPGGAYLRAAALLILLAVVALRPTISEDWQPPDRWVQPEGDDPESALSAWPTPSVSSALTALVGLAAVLWLAGETAAGRLSWRSIPGLGGVLLLAAGTILSTTEAAHRGPAIHAAAIWLGELLLFVLLVQLIARYRDLRWATAALSATLTFTAAKGLHQHFVEMPATRFYYESRRVAEQYTEAVARRAIGEPAQSLRDAESPEDEQRRAWFEDRLGKGALTGYLSHTNLYAGLLMIGLLTAIGFVLDERRAGPAGRISTTAGLFCVLILAAALLLTRSRGAMVAGAVGAVMLFAAVRFREALLARRRLVAALTVFVVLAGVGAVIAVGVSTGGLVDRTLSFRWQYWTATIGMLGEHALTGVGPACYGAYYPYYMVDSAVEEVQSPHNIVLQAFAELGLLGGIGLLLWIAMSAWRLFAAAGAGTGSADPTTAAGVSVEGTPAKGGKADGPAGAPGRAAMIRAAGPAAILALMLVVLWSWIGAPDPLLFAFLILIPALLWFVLFAALHGDTGDADADRPLPHTTAALGCAAAAALLHGLIDINLFHPAGGTVMLATAAMFLAGRNLRAESSPTGGAAQPAPPPPPAGAIGRFFATVGGVIGPKPPQVFTAPAPVMLALLAAGGLAWFWIAVHRPRAEADRLVAEARTDMFESRLTNDRRRFLESYGKLDRASKIDPNSTAALEGMIDFHMRRYRRAIREEHDIAAGRRAGAELNTDDIRRYFINAALNERARLQQRIVEFARRRMLDPTPFATLCELHRVLAEEEAERAFAALHNRKGTWGIVPLTMMFEPLGRMGSSGAQLSWAATAAGDAVRRRPRDPATRWNFAQALEALGDSDPRVNTDRAALHEYREALRLSQARAAHGGGLPERMKVSAETAVKRLTGRL